MCCPPSPSPTTNKRPRGEPSLELHTPARALVEELVPPVSGSESEGSSEYGDTESDVENLFFRPLYAGPLAHDPEADSEEESSLIDEELTEDEDEGIDKEEGSDKDDGSGEDATIGPH
ncbi:hypothetical protein ACP4OV_020562 [Aristida adscensionis]